MSKVHSLPNTRRVFTQDNCNSTYLELAVRISRVDLMKSLTIVIFATYISMAEYTPRKKANSWDTVAQRRLYLECTSVKDMFI